jgi:Flp pilus assembly protein TadG
MNITVLNHTERSSERGMVIVYVAIMLFVLLGLAGVAIDGALLASTSQQLQNAADGAALNAVRYLESETDTSFPVTRDAAIAVAQANEAAKVTVKLDANYGNSSTGDIVVGYWDASSKTFTPTVSYPNAVRVHANRTAGNADGPLAMMLGPVFGKDSSNVGATATAVVATPAEALVIILDPTGHAALQINGTNSLIVQGGKIQVNSNNSCGLSLVGTPTMSAMLTSVVGGACYPDGSILGPVQENASVVSDPLADLLPTVASWNAFKGAMPLPMGPAGKIIDSGTYDPGYYPKGLNVTASGEVHLNPGSYMFGDDVKLGGSAIITGSGVTLFFDKGVGLDIAGDGAGMQCTPPGEGSQFYGITLFMHRQSTGPSLCKIAGGGVFKLEGIAYVPSAELIMGGTPGKEIGAILAFKAKTEGTTSFTITGKGVPQLTDEPPAAFLVE